MKYLLILAFFFTFSLSAFAQADSVVTENNILSGKWKLVEFKNLTTGAVTDTALMQNGSAAFYKKVRLTLYDSVGLGEVWGQSFCNNMEGYYRVYPKNKLTISGWSGTKAGCLYESKLSDAMHAVSGYRRNKDTLFILYNHDSEEMVFIRDK
jgi:META domain